MYKYIFHLLRKARGILIMAKLVTCKTCKAEIASSAKVCPHCGAKRKKPIFLRVWFILLLIVGIAAGSLFIRLKMADETVTVVTNGETTYTKFSEVNELVKRNHQAYLDAYRNSDAIISFTATIDHTEPAYSSSGKYEGFTSYCLGHYIEVVGIPNEPCGKGDKIKVTGRFGEAQTVGDQVTYIFVEADSIEVVK